MRDKIVVFKQLNNCCGEDGAALSSLTLKGRAGRISKELQASTFQLHIREHFLRRQGGQPWNRLL